MGTRGRTIIGMDVDELLKLLNKAFADEWLAYYQYWVGAKIVKGESAGENWHGGGGESPLRSKA